MSTAALILSFIAVLISGLGYYRAHHHVSKKLFAFVSLSTSFFDRKELPIAILNAGNSDVVLLGCSVSMDFRGEHPHSMSRDSDKIVFEPSFNGLLNPGDATVANVQFHPSQKKYHGQLWRAR